MFNLSKINILTEAPNDELFDIDKEVDAQIKRVQKRLAKDNEANTPEPTEEEQDINTQDVDTANEEEVPAEDNPTDAPTDDNTNDDNPNGPTEEDTENDQDGGYDYMDGSADGTVPDNYEAKQTIPDLKILSSLSDKEYKLCNIKIIQQFHTLKKEAESVINNLIPTVTTVNVQQRQTLDIVNKNLYDMLENIDNYIIYRNNNIYEENVRVYLTYLKRYQIAIKIIRTIVDENIKSKNE